MNMPMPRRHNGCMRIFGLRIPRGAVWETFQHLTFQTGKDQMKSSTLLAGGMLALALGTPAAAQQPSPAQDEAAVVTAAAASLSAQGQYNYNAAAAAVQEEAARAAALETS